MNRNFVIALDIDDVCLDLMPTWLSFYNRDFNDNLTAEQITDWDISQFVKPEAKQAIYEYIKYPDVFKNSLPVKGAIDSIKKIRETGFRIIYVTANNPSEVKEEWLKKYSFMDNKKDFYQAYDKSLIHADILLDDKYENAKDFNYGEGWLFTRPWNKKFEYSLRISNWEQFIIKLEAQYRWEVLYCYRNYK